MKIKDVVELFNKESKNELSKKYKDKVIITILNSNKLYSHKDTDKFDFQDFNKNPKNYKTNLSKYVK